MPFDTSQAVAHAARLKTAGGRVGSKGSLVFRRTVLAIVGDAKALAPVDTGFLSGSIGSDVQGDGRFGKMSAEIGPTAEYGVYQEFGTSTQPGTPFLTPAFDRQIGGYTAALAQLAEEELL